MKLVFSPIFTSETKLQGNKFRKAVFRLTNYYLSLFLYGKQSKTSPVSTGDFLFQATHKKAFHRDTILHNHLYIHPIQKMVPKIV